MSEIENYFREGAGRDWLLTIHGPNRNTSRRAALRRCKTIAEVLRTSVFYALWNPRPEELKKASKERWAVIACAIAELNQVDAPEFAAAMADSRDGKAKISGQRFTKLMRTDDWEELLTRTRRILRHVKSVDAADFARIIDGWVWADTRLQLAEQYYNFAPDEN